MAKIHAETEFEKYRVIQDRIYISDFDELLLNTKKLNKRENKQQEVIYYNHKSREEDRYKVSFVKNDIEIKIHDQIHFIQ